MPFARSNAAFASASCLRSAAYAGSWGMGSPKPPALQFIAGACELIPVELIAFSSAEVAGHAGEGGGGGWLGAERGGRFEAGRYHVHHGAAALDPAVHHEHGRAAGRDRDVVTQHVRAALEERGFRERTTEFPPFDMPAVPLTAAAAGAIEGAADLAAAEAGRPTPAASLEGLQPAC